MPATITPLTSAELKFRGRNIETKFSTSPLKVTLEFYSGSDLITVEMEEGEARALYARLHEEFGEDEGDENDEDDDVIEA